MTAIYSSTSITGFNANPPSNDGLKTAQNQADWTEQVIGKVGTPLKTAIEQINTNVAAAFLKTVGGSAATEVTTAYVIQASDQSKILYYTGSGGDTLTTPDAAAVGAPFTFHVVNAGTGSFTLDGSGAQTINGSLTASFKVGQGALVFTDGANWFASNLPLNNPSLSVEQTFGGSVIDGDVVYWNTGSAYWDQAQANTANNAAVGIADANNGNVYFSGQLPDSLLTGLTPGAKYYLSDNAAGEITATAPTANRIRVGYATNATGFIVNVGPEPNPGSMVLIDTQTANNSASLNFTSGIGSSYDDYEFVLDKLLPETDNAVLWSRISDDGGSTWESGASDYTYIMDTARPGDATAYNSTGAAQIQWTRDAGASSGIANDAAGFSGRITFSTPSAAVNHAFQLLEGSYISANGTITTSHGSAFELGGAAINGVQFLMSTGNVVSGVVRLYARAK